MERDRRPSATSSNYSRAGEGRGWEEGGVIDCGGGAHLLLAVSHVTIDHGSFPKRTVAI